MRMRMRMRMKRYNARNKNSKYNHFHRSTARPMKQNSQGSWIPDSNPLDSGFQHSGFRIPIVQILGFQISISLFLLTCAALPVTVNSLFSPFLSGYISDLENCHP